MKFLTEFIRVVYTAVKSSTSKKRLLTLILSEPRRVLNNSIEWSLPSLLKHLSLLLLVRNW